MSPSHPPASLHPPSQQTAHVCPLATPLTPCNGGNGGNDCDRVQRPDLLICTSHSAPPSGGLSRDCASGPCATAERRARGRRLQDTVSFIPPALATRDLAHSTFSTLGRYLDSSQASGSLPPQVSALGLLQCGAHHSAEFHVGGSRSTRAHGGACAHEHAIEHASDE